MRKMVDSIVTGKEVSVGLEDSKRTWKLCVRSEKIVVQELSMPARYDVLRAYLRNNYPDCKVTIIYEAGFKGFTLHDKLVGDGFGCVVTPPHKVTEEKANRVKCDKRDARRLAFILESGDYSSCHVPDEERRKDRQISRTLIQFQKDITRTKNRIRKFLDFHGFDETLPAGTWYDRDYDQLENLTLDPTILYCLNLLIQNLRQLMEVKKALKIKLKELTKKERYRQTFKLFASAPGVGWFTAIRLVLEWGEDLSRFSSNKKFASFCGLTASEHSSGDFVWRGNITRQSNPAIRAWLIECAWTAYKRDPALLHKYQAVLNNTGSKKKAIVAVARKLAVRLKTLVAKDTPYQFAIAA